MGQWAGLAVRKGRLASDLLTAATSTEGAIASKSAFTGRRILGCHLLRVSQTLGDEVSVCSIIPIRRGFGVGSAKSHC